MPIVWVIFLTHFFLAVSFLSLVTFFAVILTLLSSVLHGDLELFLFQSWLLLGISWTRLRSRNRLLTELGLRWLPWCWLFSIVHLILYTIAHLLMILLDWLALVFEISIWHIFTAIWIHLILVVHHLPHVIHIGAWLISHFDTEHSVWLTGAWQLILLLLALIHEGIHSFLWRDSFTLRGYSSSRLWLLSWVYNLSFMTTWRNFFNLLLNWTVISVSFISLEFSHFLGSFDL